jgi:hypothetical protein
MQLVTFYGMYRLRLEFGKKQYVGPLEVDMFAPFMMEKRHLTQSSVAAPYQQSRAGSTDRIPLNSLHTGGQLQRFDTH